ncbi:MAG: Histidine kinase, gyrase and HSP90-like ATPase [Verrucomicrobiaceae bacterium]|nr:Histidine kinase, gyrase and HSP90-like ATPase [Verrucomicrobiaceae bacterium]
MKALVQPVILIGVLCLSGHPLQAIPPPLVETIAAVRSKVTRGMEEGPVHVRGGVTFCKSQLGIAFVQDQTGGLAFFPRGVPGMRQPKNMDTVELTGIPQVIDGMLMLCGVRSTPATPLPPEITFLPAADAVKIKPRLFELSTLADMRMNAELVHSSGVMRRVIQKSKTGVTVEVSTAAGFVVVRLPWLPADSDLAGWTNQQVTFNGVIVCRADKRLLPEDADAVVFVTNASQWQIKPAIIEAAFASPPLKASQVWRALPLTRAGARIHVEGVVSAVRGPHTIDLRMDDGSVEISSRQAKEFHAGERLSVVCWLLNKHGVMLLVDGVCKSLGETTPAVPVPLLSAAEAAKTRYGELVRFSGVVRDVFRIQDRGRMLVALKDGGTCAVLLEPPVTIKSMPSEGIGASYDLTGIFESGKDARSAGEGANFILHPRTNADLRLLSYAPWWTRQRLTAALWTLVMVAGVAVPGAFFLRWKIWKQEQKIRLIERTHASAEERKRIAGEFHDSLQQELASASLHLETLSEACQTAPQRMPMLLDDLSAMLRHCQIEARNLIWDLRADDEFREGVTAPVRSWLAMRQRLVVDTSLHFESKGDETTLPPDTCRHVMRITQEAVNNAVAHAGATRVSVRMSHEADRLEVLVEDDGRGFNTAAAPSTDKGHYGLSMLEERAQRIHARIDFRSELNNGTLVRLVVPHSSFRS